MDVKGDLKTIHTDPAHTKGQLALSLGSKTDAVSLYAYIATVALKDLENEQNIDQNDLNLIALLKDATQTTKLAEIPAHLERLIVIVKAKISQFPEDDDKPWSDLMNSLKVETKAQGNKTTEVVLKTTVAVAMDFFEDDLVISDLSLKVTENGLSVGVAIASTVETSYVTEMLEKVKGTLSMIENADAETLANLKEMTNAYVQMAEEIVKGVAK